ncbi:MAG: DUF4065 domain-containing protein [Candidatus Symbiothrix sp.]|jgi:uncharacterized phage-associated protein|nr:DUF4065 domain-containing protein [Candidatus Symbiothrix sp.]
METQKVLDVAYKIINSCTDKELGDMISNLKLQKMLYYVQGFHLAFFDKPLFEDEIVAWQYGPVVPDMYRKFAQFGSSPLFVPENTKIVYFDDDSEDIFQEVIEGYGQFSATRLMKMTHNEPPWRTTEINHVVSKNKMKRYFLTQIDES